MMKKPSYDYHFELVIGKSIIFYGDTYRGYTITGTYIGILNTLADVEKLENVIEYADEGCYIPDWTCIFTYNCKRKMKRETKTFENSRDLIAYAKSFFTTPSPVESDTPPESQAETP